MHVFYYADANAFKPADKIQRSPIAAGVASADADLLALSSSLLSADKQCERSSLNAGLLSSTLIDASDRDVTGVDAMDNVAMKLFTQIQPDGLQACHVFLICLYCFELLLSVLFFCCLFLICSFVSTY